MLNFILIVAYNKAVYYLYIIKQKQIKKMEKIIDYRTELGTKKVIVYSIEQFEKLKSENPNSFFQGIHAYCDNKPKSKPQSKPQSKHYKYNYLQTAKPERLYPL
jgi:CRISPR/Cas system-associated exonuclease Cas4 (RecB family)